MNIYPVGSGGNIQSTGASVKTIVNSGSSNHIASGNSASAKVSIVTPHSIDPKDLEVLSQKRDRIWTKWKEFRDSIPEEIRKADDQRKLELKDQIKVFAEELRQEGLIDSLLGVGTFGSVFKLSSGSHSVAMKFFMTDSVDRADGAKENLCQLEKDELQAVQRVLDERRQELQEPNRFDFVQREISLPRADSQSGLNSLVTNIMPGSNIITNVFEADKAEVNEDYLRCGLSDEYLLEFIDCFRTLSKARIDLKDTGRSQNSHYYKTKLYLFDFIGTVENESTKPRLDLGEAKPMTRTLYTLLTSVQLHENEQAFYMDQHRLKMAETLEKQGSSLAQKRNENLRQLDRVLKIAEAQNIVEAGEISEAITELQRIQELDLEQQLQYFVYPLTQEANDFLIARL